MSNHNEKSDRNARIFKQYQTGMSFHDIGLFHGISKQAVHQIVKRELEKRKS